MSAKQQLPEEIKRFIVKSLAVYESPSEVVSAVKEKFNRKITRQGVQSYDPTKVAGEDLSEDLKTLFTETRKIFDDSEIIPLSKKIVRIKKLARFAENFENMGNDQMAAQMIEQIAKEEGGMFSNKYKHDVALNATVQAVVRVPPKLSPEEWSQQQSEKP